MFRTSTLRISKVHLLAHLFAVVSSFVLSACSLNLNVEDIGPSETLFTAKPFPYTNQTDAIFKFAVESRTPVSYKCSLDEEQWRDCTSPEAFTNLASGPHAFKVLVIEETSKKSSESSVKWTVDTDAPTLTVTQVPDALNNDITATFQFAATDTLSPLSDYQCQHTSSSSPTASFVPCASSVPLVGLTEGTHTYKIRATDAAGNVSAEHSHTWVVDLTPPTLQLTAKPAAATTSASAVFNFTHTETGGGVFAGYECQLDGGIRTSCTSGVSFSSLSQGAHSFTLYASDTAGNNSTPITYHWIVDAGAPVLTSFSIANGAPTIGFAYTTTQIVATPSYSAITSMRFSEMADFSDTTWVPFSSAGTVTLKNPAGLKTIYAQVRNAAGTVSNILSDTVTLDLGNPPVVFLTSPVAGAVHAPGDTMTIAWSCSPGAGPIPLAANPIKAIRYTVDDGITYHTIAENRPNNVSATTGDYSWVLPAQTPSGQTLSPTKPMKILVSCSSEAGVLTSAISEAINSQWKVLIGEPGNLNEGIHINAADLTANASGTFGFFADSQNKMYFTKFHGIMTVNQETGLISPWIGDTYNPSCNPAQAKFINPIILDINNADEMLLFSFDCSAMARVRISDKAILWSKQLPTIKYDSAVLNKQQQPALRYVKTDHILYFSNEAFWMVDLNSADKNPVKVFGTPGACGTLGTIDTMADVSPIPCPTSDLYMTLLRPDLNKFWIQINGKTIEFQRQGSYGKYKIAQDSMTTGTWGSFYTRCLQLSSQANKIYCMRAQYEGSNLAFFDLTTETWSTSFALNKHYKNMPSHYSLGAAKDFIYAFSVTTNELYKVVDDGGVFTSSFVAGVPFFTYGNGSDPTKTAFTPISSISYDSVTKNIYLRGPRHLRRLHIDTATPGGPKIDTISTGYHPTAGNSSAYASLTVSETGLAAFSQIAGVPANLWNSYNISAWSPATTEYNMPVGPAFYTATSTATSFPSPSVGEFNTTNTTLNLRSLRKIGTFLPNGKLYFYGSSGLLDESDLWIFESDSLSGKIKPVAGGAGPVNYVSTDHGNSAWGAYLSDIYGMQPNADGDLLIFDGWRLRKVTVTTEALTPKIYDEINFLTLAGKPNVARWVHAVHDNVTGWSYFAAANNTALGQTAQVWAAHPQQGFVELSTEGWLLPQEGTTARSINLAVTPLGLLLLDTNKKRILTTPLLPAPPP
ncbi:hemagglutinin [Bdellovibrio sp. 22V]|uniref:hemagglutinin n=1 Tax=Bdellovibrio sp. 22V TaxID=3044166 RepID=UPI002543D423|nr:hemagglutinin [Bdellovibrio sp. 22V]WII72796.1 hemagglutinin [Bdellovibrio sp. 22V]